MRKALIVTLYGNHNYGNKFQNFAMQEVLNKYNYDAYTLNMQKIRQNSAPKVTCIERLKNLSVRKLLKKLKEICNSFARKRRFHAFKNFSDEHIKIQDFTSSDELKAKYEKVCIGSDQIWNPELENFYYSYAKFQDSDKVFSYAPSFGVSKFDAKYSKEIREGLENVKDISVREEKGANIIKKITGRDVEVLVDPTMLLKVEQWDKILKEPTRKPKKEFVMVYFLGNYSKERRKYIKRFAKEKNLEIVELGQIDLKKYYCTDPGEFLYFVKKSKIIFTDSFHGAVFSILYNRPFYILKREDQLTSMSSRTETLLKKFELQERMLEDYTQEIVLKIDFTRVNEILKEEREKSDKFLKKALDIKEN